MANGDVELPLSPHAESPQTVLDALQVNPDRGLEEDDARRRRDVHGRNELGARRGVPAWRILLSQLQSAVVLLLIAAALAGFAIGEVVEAVAVVVVLVVNTITGFFTEYRALRSMESLDALVTTVAEVERDDRRDEIDAAELVPGDIVGLDAGEQVPADLRLIEADDLTIEESALTGESAPVAKDTAEVGPDVALPDRTGMAFMGTKVQSGRGRGVVVATGSATEVGNVSELTAGTDDSVAPLQEGLERLGRILSLVVIGVAAALAVLGLAQGMAADEVVELSIALAIAVVPEGLPAVATLTLTVGMRRMARRNALVRRLPVVETLGSTTVIASDKTGTLTANKMTVVDRRIAPGADETALLQTAVLCNDADIDPDGDPVGDPTEVALLEAAAQSDLDWRDLQASASRERAVPFDPAAKRMAVVVDDTVHVKGAPEVLLDRADDADLLASVDTMTRAGLRTLAFARRRVSQKDLADLDDDDLFTGLTTLGVVGMEDPPRPEAVATVETCRAAGIRIVMVTGDQPETARAIAGRLGLRTERVLTGVDLANLDQDAVPDAVRDVDVFARVAPEQKLRLVEALQMAGHVVAVTGDGVNDAPALSQADVGVAMGRAGTDVARDAADIVLADDNLSTIESAVEEGRRVFANIRRFAQYLFSWHVAEVLVIATGVVLGLPAPLAGLMVLWNNLIIDVLPSFALALEPGRNEVMEEPPRPPGEPVISGSIVRRILAHGALVAAVSLTAYGFGLWQLRFDTTQLQTLVFVTITSAQLLAVFNARSDTGSGFAGATANPWLWAAIGLTLLLEALAFAVLPLREVLGLTVMPAAGWVVAALLAPIPLLVVQLVRWLRRRSEPDE